MTLEDFFTSSELENGLIGPDRVNELITVMQNEKDLVVNSFGQTTRQWSKVATIIAATENRDCLDLFIQLNGLLFIDKWLKDAQTLKDDDENSFLEELIISLLRALEKLPIDDKRLFSSGIMKTVQDLVANSNHTVREKAKELCDNWMLIQDKNKIPEYAENSDNVESRPPDGSMNSDARNQEPLDHVEPSSKSTNDDDKGDLNCRSEVVGKSDENHAGSSSKSMIADGDNSLESCVKTDVLSDKDDVECPNTSSNSNRDNEANNTINDVQSNGNSENRSSFVKASISNKKSDMELGYGMIDPLEIARQVSNEVEREADSRERSCSTSEKTPSAIKRPNTPDSKNGQEIQSQSQIHPVGGSDKEVSPEPLKDAETLVSQISEVAQESEPDTVRPFSGFDLNQEVCSEEVDNSNQRSGFHDFDLNVAEGGQEDKMVTIPGLPSGEESSVANPLKPERLQWDLNSVGDDQNGWQSPYHASSSSASSSSSKQPILRNIDLNLNDQSDQPPNSEESLISIFGSRVEVKKNDKKPLPQPEPKLDFNQGKHHNNGMFFSIPMYGSSSHGMPMHAHIPYMVDSRGTSFVPQIMGSQSPSPFFMNMAAAAAPPPQALPQNNFDVNSGLMINGGLRQFFPQHVNEQASSSSVLGKRHEHDSSWQLFPVNKRQQPPWR